MKFSLFFYKINHISFNIGLRILNHHTLGHPLPSAEKRRKIPLQSHGPLIVKAHHLQLNYRGLARVIYDENIDNID